MVARRRPRVGGTGSKAGAAAAAPATGVFFARLARVAWGREMNLGRWIGRPDAGPTHPSPGLPLASGVDDELGVCVTGAPGVPRQPAVRRVTPLPAALGVHDHLEPLEAKRKIVGVLGNTYR